MTRIAKRDLVEALINRNKGDRVMPGAPSAQREYWVKTYMRETVAELTRRLRDIAFQVYTGPTNTAELTREQWDELNAVRSGWSIEEILELATKPIERGQKIATGAVFAMDPQSSMYRERYQVVGYVGLGVYEIEFLPLSDEVIDLIFEYGDDEEIERELDRLQTQVGTRKRTEFSSRAEWARHF